ncbi:MAG: hypothetical protein U1F57_08730 [bacterium]
MTLDYIHLSSSSGNLSLLDRFSSHTLSGEASLTSSQTQVDQCVSTFLNEATDLRTLAAMATGSLFYRFGRLGSLALASRAGQAAPLLQVASYGIGLASEVTAFQGMSDYLSSVQQPAGSYWNRWRTSFVQFGLLKIGGAAALGQNPLFQHLLQDTTMVAGHQLTARLGWTPAPEGNLTEQFLHAEITNLQLGAGMSLIHRGAPGLPSLERGLDLSIRARSFGDGEGSDFLDFRLPPSAELIFAEAGLGNGIRNQTASSFDPAQEAARPVYMSSTGDGRPPGNNEGPANGRPLSADKEAPAPSLGHLRMLLSQEGLSPERQRELLLQIARFEGEDLLLFKHAALESAAADPRFTEFDAFLDALEILAQRQEAFPIDRIYEAQEAILKRTSESTTSQQELFRVFNTFPYGGFVKELNETLIRKVFRPPFLTGEQDEMQLRRLRNPAFANALLTLHACGHMASNFRHLRGERVFSRLLENLERSANTLQAAQAHMAPFGPALRDVVRHEAFGGRENVRHALRLLSFTFFAGGRPGYWTDQTLDRLCDFFGDIGELEHALQFFAEVSQNVEIANLYYSRIGAHLPFSSAPHFRKILNALRLSDVEDGSISSQMGLLLTNPHFDSPPEIDAALDEILISQTQASTRVISLGYALNNPHLNEGQIRRIFTALFERAGIKPDALFDFVYSNPVNPQVIALPNLVAKAFEGAFLSPTLTPSAIARYGRILRQMGVSTAVLNGAISRLALSKPENPAVFLGMADTVLQGDLHLASLNSVFENLARNAALPPEAYKDILRSIEVHQGLTLIQKKLLLSLMRNSRPRERPR